MRSAARHTVPISMRAMASDTRTPVALAEAEPPRKREESPSEKRGRESASGAADANDASRKRPRPETLFGYSLDVDVNGTGEMLATDVTVHEAKGYLDWVASAPHGARKKFRVYLMPEYPDVPDEDRPFRVAEVVKWSACTDPEDPRCQECSYVRLEKVTTSDGVEMVAAHGDSGSYDCTDPDNLVLEVIGQSRWKMPADGVDPSGTA